MNSLADRRFLLPRALGRRERPQWAELRHAAQQQSGSAFGITDGRCVPIPLKNSPIFELWPLV